MMRRHDSLIPLTHDHHHALGQARRLELAANGGPEARLNQARTFLDFFDSETRAHFREEEESLFPLVIGEDEAQPFLSRVMLDHLRIHALVSGLRSDIEREDISSERLKRLGQALSHHIRLEEKVLFPMIERMVPGVLLQELSLRSPSQTTADYALIGSA
jgi:iron-sulfur cluster repair protein YtfE (RIC family)